MVAYIKKQLKSDTEAIEFILLKMKRGEALNMTIDFGIFKEAKRFIITRTK